MGKLYSRAVIGSHFFVPVTEVGDLATARARCTVTSKFDSTKQIPIYREVGEWFGWPLYMPGIGTADEITDIRIRPTAAGWGMKTELWEDQQSVHAKFVQAIAHGIRGFLIHAKTGWGKTVAALAMMAHYGSPVLVVVPKSDLIQQWVERAIEHTSLTRGDIGIVQERKAVWQDKKLVIALVHSLALDYLPREFRTNFGQVWFDEAHASNCPETFAPVTQRFPSMLRGALTATPERPDGLDKIFKFTVVQKTIVAKAGKRMPSKVIVLSYRCRYPKEIYGRTPLERRGALISHLARDQRRNSILAASGRELLKNGRQVLFISDRTFQLYMIRKLLIKRYGLSEKNIGYYCNTLTVPGRKRSIKISEADREEAKTRNAICATYGMIKYGTDIKPLGGMIICTPQSQMDQPRGRIERWKDFLVGNVGPVVVDLRDLAYEKAVEWSNERIRQYRKDGLEIVFKGEKEAKS